MSENETCPENVFRSGDWRGHTCGKPVKRDGLCGIHAAAREKRLRNERAALLRQSEAQVIVNRLRAHGVDAWASREGARITMSAEALADLLDTKAVQ